VTENELGKRRTLEAATGLVVSPVLRPFVDRAQKRGDWDEADRLMLRILSYEGEDEACHHLRIRGLIARGRTEDALAEASLVFLLYRRTGRYREALQVTRAMRLIDADSTRPYELEMEFLVEIGWFEQARDVLASLIALHQKDENVPEILASKARFSLLCKRPQTARCSRPPQAWQAPERLPSGNPSNLPATIEPEAPDWLDVWWDQGES
jgi:Flp pilus assembly protein TadD